MRGELGLLKVEMADLSPENVDDALLVCPPFSELRDNENVKIGLRIRKNWLLDLHREIGPCAKIAYLNDKPVGMMQYSPLHNVPYFKTERRDVLYIHCIYVKRNVRNRGIGSALLRAIINDMRKPNKLFKSGKCRLLATTARERYGFTQIRYFKSKGFLKTESNIDAGLVYFLLKTGLKKSLDIPYLEPLNVIEENVKIFFSPTCHMCKFMNENIKAKIREVDPTIDIEECNLWVQSQEALHRRITSVATYIRGRPILPMEPQEFWETIRRFTLQTK